MWDCYSSLQFLLWCLPTACLVCEEEKRGGFVLHYTHLRLSTNLSSPSTIWHQFYWVVQNCWSPTSFLISNIPQPPPKMLPQHCISYHTLDSPHPFSIQRLGRAVLVWKGTLYVQEPVGCCRLLQLPLKNSRHELGEWEGENTQPKVFFLEQQSASLHLCSLPDLVIFFLIPSTFVCNYLISCSRATVPAASLYFRSLSDLST